MIGASAVLVSLVAQNVGAAFAKHLFPLVGAYGTTGLRIALAALLLFALRRPWRRRPSRAMLSALIAYGAMLGSMNLLIYQAFARLPIGIATGIEVLGPLMVVLCGSRSRRDIVWFVAAVIGLVLLLPLRSGAALDPDWIGFCRRRGDLLGALHCLWEARFRRTRWGCGRLGNDSRSRHFRADWRGNGRLCLTGTVGPSCRFRRGDPVERLALLAGNGGDAPVAVPRLRHSAQRCTSCCGAGGFVVLGEVLTPLQWFAILLIMAASSGSAVSATKQPALTI
jgi:inner membrane transporter RhtA